MIRELDGLFKVVKDLIEFGYNINEGESIKSTGLIFFNKSKNAEVYFDKKGRMTKLLFHEVKKGICHVSNDFDAMEMENYIAPIYRQLSISYGDNSIKITVEGNGISGFTYDYLYNDKGDVVVYHDSRHNFWDETMDCPLYFDSEMNLVFGFIKIYLPEYELSWLKRKGYVISMGNKFNIESNNIFMTMRKMLAKQIMNYRDLSDSWRMNNEVNKANDMIIRKL